MNAYRSLIVAFWLILFAYWAIAAIGAKRTVGTRERRKAMALRLGLIVLIVLALRVPVLRQMLRIAQSQVTNVALLNILGVVLCGIGVALAIWARVHLARNWGMPMSRKENPELVTTGPYAYIRHPIYAGILLAMLGSTIASSVVWVLPLILFGTYFVYSARREEELMTSQFPEAYPAYMKRSNMLLPWPARAGRSPR
ncbi:MAG TPA: isoprenylcysteine carboxylmethyltransferase family protein [Casimicrobiaceae bacterium]|nr:isoprenylcysteine carboxylmethyltransferase family protein [Casimicrobiaceae bacterium]